MSLLGEWARRHQRTPPESGSAVTDYLAGLTPADVTARRGLPLAAAEGIRSFYDQIDRVPRVCEGTACRFAGAHALAEALGRRGPVSDVRCLGHCYDAPAIRVGDAICAGREQAETDAWLRDPDHAPPQPPPSHIPRRSLVDAPAVLRGLLPGTATDWRDDYRLPAGPAVLAAIEASGLRGRGGAAFPTAAKWKIARDTPARDRVVVANGDEGDPGSFVDRLLLEDAPHAVLAGMLGCARAISATRGIVYIRAEYPRAHETVARAIAEARGAGMLGGEFDVEIVSGAGSYVCGEESALLNSIEGLRGEPRVRPPYPAQSGLFGLPTVVQNVETLAVVPHIVRGGRGGHTKAVSIAGAVASPGVVEVPFGMPLDEVLREGADGPAQGRTWRMAVVGGPMGRVLAVHEFDTPLSYEALPGLGHAGVVVLDDTVSPRAVAEHLFSFARAESCGACTPCRVGTSRLAAIRERDTLLALLDTLEIGSLCGFGQAVPRPIRDLLRLFGDEVLAPC